MIYGPDDIDKKEIETFLRIKGYEISFDDSAVEKPGIRGKINGIYFAFTYDPNDLGLLLLAQPADQWESLIEAFATLVVHSSPFCTYRDQFIRKSKIICCEWKGKELQDKRYKELEGTESINDLHWYNLQV